ncbi:uncharacterized protein LOC125646546 [Ostrea edulis]|uniref:uncharacterized protein LOC125646546 n=1 Tax=Ostrea edulis TaxID=37623 RepID=UPI0024AFBC2B|nr:uncharacterized protein LOC125646546 [Ostrea edulis]
MNDPVYGLIIGNIIGARDPSNPDPEWDNRRNYKDVVGKNPQEMVKGLAVQTRSQIQKEKEKYKSLKVTSITNNLISADDMRVAQKEDATLDKYREYAKTGTRKFTGQQNVSWFVMENNLLFRYFQSPKVIQLEMG